MKILIFVIVSNLCFAQFLKPKDSSSSAHLKLESVLSKLFYEEIYTLTKGLKPEEEVKKAKISLNDGKRGKMIIEMLKQKNREKIARMRGLDPKKATSGSELVSQQREKNKEAIAKIRAQELMLDKKYAHLPIQERKKKIWQELARREIIDLKKTVEKNKGWRKNHKNTLYSWKENYKKYVGNIETYRESLDKIPLVLPIDESEKKKEVETVIVEDHYIIPASLSLDIRDQGSRPTCSSFAGIRALEILAKQNGKNLDLSEQYFYWASKPKCRTSPCRDRGSWVGHGLEFTKRNPIPLESSCPYKATSVSGNDTQLPLKNSCKKGALQVSKFSYLKTLDEALAHLKNNQPVVASFKLTPNFYKTKGLILDKDKFTKGPMDKHSAGHAVLLIGHVKLPKILNEGSVCFVTANSWGKGWGRGGHACISEKWVLNQRQGNPFVAIDLAKL